MVGVTGTNGKTSCAHWIAPGLDAAGRRAAVLGTLGNGLLGASRGATNTTPDAALLHEMLAEVQGRGRATPSRWRCRRTASTRDASTASRSTSRCSPICRAIISTITRRWRRTARRRRSLFSWPGLRVGVINADDPFGQSLIDAARANGRKVLTYGFGAADIGGSRLVATAAGLAFTVETPWGKGEVQTRVVGAFNASNLLGVLGVLLVSGVELGAGARAPRARSTPPPGRMQRLGGGGAPLVVVDYAHTPDALEKVLTALRPAVATAASSSACSAAAAIAIAASGRRWGASRHGSPIASRHQRQSARREIPRRSPATSCTAFATRAIAATRRARPRGRDRDCDRRARPRRRRAARRQGPRDYQETNGARQPFLDCRSRGARAGGMEPAMMDTATAAQAIAAQLAWRQRVVPRRHDRLARRSRRAICSSRSRASASTATTSCDRRSNAARPPRSSPPIAWPDSAQRARRRCRTVLAVADPLRALGALAAFWRRRFSIPVIAIVGSNGKTTVKEMIAAILRAQFGADARARDARAISTTRSACR